MIEVKYKSVLIDFPSLPLERSYHTHRQSDTLTGDRKLTPSVLGCIFISIQLIINFSTASETAVGVKIVQSVAINVVTSTHPS